MTPLPSGPERPIDPGPFRPAPTPPGAREAPKKPPEAPSNGPREAPAGSFRAREARPRVFGILGGIASGKSTVSEALAGPDGVILSADGEAHAALELPEVQARLVERFGEGVIGADGRTDRPALGEIIFGDQEARKALEGWIHPVVRARLWEGFRRAVDQAAPTVIVDVPLLLESAIGATAPGSTPAADLTQSTGSSTGSSTGPLPESLRAPAPPADLPEDPPADGLLRYCDYLVFVDAPLDDRDARAVKYRGWQPGEVARRQKAQMPLDEKRAHADLIIHNDQGPDELRARVHTAVAGLDGPPSTASLPPSASPNGDRPD